MSRTKEYLENLNERYGSDELIRQMELEEQEYYFENKSIKYEVKINGKTLVGTKFQLVTYLEDLIDGINI